MKKHIHKLKKINIGTKAQPYYVYKCILPSCTTYYAPNLVEGKIVLCNRCNQPMILTKHALTLARPHCLDCVKSSKKRIINDIDEYLANVGEE